MNSVWYIFKLLNFNLFVNIITFIFIPNKILVHLNQFPSIQRYCKHRNIGDKATNTRGRRDRSNDSYNPTRHMSSTDQCGLLLKGLIWKNNIPAPQIKKYVFVMEGHQRVNWTVTTESQLYMKV